MATTITQAEIVKLLGRPLTTAETNAYDTYLNIAIEAVEELLGYSLSNSHASKEFDLRENYRTVFTDPFRRLHAISVDDEDLDEDTFSARQWDKRTADWYNSIVFDDARSGVVTVSADWGFGRCLPSDLQLLIARSFDQITRSNLYEGIIESKKNEDFSINFKEDVTQSDQFNADNAKIINKYSIRSIGEIQNGCVPSVRHYYL